MTTTGRPCSSEARSALPAGPRAEPAAVAGVGIDLCDPARLRDAQGRPRRGLARVVPPSERRAFPGPGLALPWAGREAVLKALGLPGVLGAPLEAMHLARDAGGRLVYRPATPGREPMDRRGVDRVVLGEAWIAGRALVVAVALALDAPPRTLRWGCLPDEGAPSRAARRAVAAALRDRGLRDAAEDLAWSGGGREAPRLLVAGRSVPVSLTHDGGLGAGVVALAARSPTPRPPTRSTPRSTP